MQNKNPTLLLIIVAYSYNVRYMSGTVKRDLHELKVVQNNPVNHRQGK